MRWVVGGPGFVRAYQSVLRNKGTSGVDGVKTEDLPRYLMYHWQDIKEELEQGKYEPQLVRGVKIPKPNGGIRQLGIPTVMDRLVQGAIHETLSPIWEQHFSDYSYGFRPKRNAHQALFKAEGYINAGRQWIIDLDLRKFFDKVQHDYLMSRVRQRVKDKTLLQLIGKYLRSGIMEQGEVQERLEGTPQGGPLSPLLSNILLHELDVELEKRGHAFVRYADDCSIFLKSKRAAQRVLASITRFIESKLHLEVNQEKTSICRPSKFVHATGYQKFKNLDAWIRTRLRYCIWKDWKRPKRRLRAFLQLGVEPSWARRYAYSRMGGWAIAGSPIMKTTVTEERLRKRGYIPFLEYYLKVKHRKSSNHPSSKRK